MVRQDTYNHIYLFKVIWELCVERHDEVGSGKICPGPRCSLRRGTRDDILVGANQTYIDTSNAYSRRRAAGSSPHSCLQENLQAKAT